MLTSLTEGGYSDSLKVIHSNATERHLSSLWILAVSRMIIKESMQQPLFRYCPMFISISGKTLSEPGAFIDFILLI